MRRWLLFGAAPVVLAVLGAVVVAGWAPFGPTLDAHEQTVVNDVEEGRVAANPSDAGRYIDANIDVLLSSEVAASVDGSALADLFDIALADDDAGATALDVVIAAVADEGAIHSPHLPRVFADALGTHMATIDANINAAFPTVDAPAPPGAEQVYLNTHDFLREVSRDREAADRLHQALNDYGEAEVARALAGSEARAERLEEIGHVQQVFTIAQTNAELGEAQRDGDAGAIASAEAAAITRRVRGAEDRAVWLARARFESPHLEEVQAVQVAAAGQPFVDDSGALKPNLARRDAVLFRAWAATQTLDRGLTAEDAGDIASGADEVISPAGVPFLEDRY